MSITINAKGTSVPFFTIGKGGTTFYQGTIDPSLFYTIKIGDYWFDTYSNSIWAWSSSLSWVVPKVDRVGSPAPLTTATTGFAYIPVSNGTPTGTPTAVTGYAPMVADSSGSKLWVYVNGAWKSATLS